MASSRFGFSPLPRVRFGMFLLGCVLLVLAVPRTTGASWNAPRSTPAARVGAIYFDGWACPLSNFHFKGLLSGPFSGRRPLFGWRDNTVESMRTQLSMARQDGLSFFLFDWYREGVDPCLNVAHDNYLKLHDHQGVGFAVLYVNHDPFGVSPEQWASLAESWATHDFEEPDYVKVDGKPLLVIFDTTLFRRQQGGAAGVNSAIATMQATAKRHGLPGVFVVGGRYTDYLNISCFPVCDQTDAGSVGLSSERYDALTEYAYTGVIEPVDGARPYADVVRAEQANWEIFRQRGPVPYIPSVMAGWDPRPWDERPYDRLFWLTRSSTEVARFLEDAISWAGLYPPTRTGSSSPALVLLEAWNELGEGAYVLPTEEDGYSYGQAIANALGLPWNIVHTRRLVLTARKRSQLRGTLLVGDHWTPCDLTLLRVERKSSGRWLSVSTTRTKPGGSFSVGLPKKPGRYRVSTSQTLRYGQTCGAATSASAIRR